MLRALKNLVSGAKADGTDSGSTLAAANATSGALSFKTVPCIATTGETFAIWLNVLYLAPLTYLFVKFFITSYLRRSNAESARVARLGKNGVDGTVDSKGRDVAAASGNATLAATIATTEEEVLRRLSNVGNLAEKAGWDAARGLEKEVYGESGEALTANVAVSDVPVPTAGGKTKKSKSRTAKSAK